MQIRRTEIINHLIRRFGYLRYLEIGVRNPADNFDRVVAPFKDGVDPEPLAPCRFAMTSDAFFGRVQPTRGCVYDIVFIDGLHLEQQVLKDVENSLLWLAPGGSIVLHDCNPSEESCQSEEYDGVSNWNGTVWKAFARLRVTRSDLTMLTVDTDWGVGIIQRGSQVLFSLPADAVLDYSFLEKNRRELLNLIAPDAFFARCGQLLGPPRAGRALRSAYIGARSSWMRARRHFGRGEGSSARPDSPGD